MHFNIIMVIKWGNQEKRLGGRFQRNTNPERFRRKCERKVKKDRTVIRRKVCIEVIEYMSMCAFVNILTSNWVL